MIKKGLALEKAQAYKQKLENIGIVINIEADRAKQSSSLALAPMESPTEPSKTTNSVTSTGAKTHTDDTSVKTALSLEPISSEQTTEEPTTSGETSQHKPGQLLKPFTCPKCNLEQDRSDECISCGIIFSKFRGRQEAAPSVVTPPPVVNSSSSDQTSAMAQSHSSDDHDQDSQSISNEEDNSVFDEDEFNPKSFGAASVTAVCGALVWMAIAMMSGYELSLIAWGIGGAIGFAAAFFGSKGQKAGIICGALAFVAILGGKYLVIDSFASQFENVFETEFMEGGLQEAYAYMTEEAELYTTEVTDDESLRQFIAENEYSESYEAAEVTAEEINYFKEEIVPGFDYIQENDPNYEEWFDHTMGEAMADIESLSTWSILVEDLGALDLLFLFLGIATAYQLGSGQKKFG